ncbi:MAG: putative lipid II flippase FtsW [Holophagaceae bacterium]|nr:putative lipid II flippase FtsW [Holophagaceae bacterium]
MNIEKQNPVDRWLLLFALLLMVFGVAWVYSATGIRHENTFFIRQCVSGFIGIALMLAFSHLDISRFLSSHKLMRGTYVIFIFLLIAVFFSPTRNGAHRWIIISGFSLQPSEFFKPFSVIWTSWLMYRHRESWTKRREAIPKLVILFLSLLLPMTLIYMEPDMGTTILILFVSLLVIFLGSAPRWVFVFGLPVLVIVGSLIVVSKEYRYERIKAFFNPASVDLSGTGYQAEQSLIAFGNGGVLGVGPAAGQQKLSFLPEAHTDFIYAIIGEELGLLGTSVVWLLFAGFLWRGCRIALACRDPFLRLCAGGFTILIVSQALINMSVVLNLAPNTGIPLPFVSYGGSSLMATLVCLGLLLSISRKAVP